MCIPALPPQSSLYYGDTIDLEDDETVDGDAPVEKVFNIPVFKAQISKWLGKCFAAWAIILFNLIDVFISFQVKKISHFVFA